MRRGDIGQRPEDRAAIVETDSPPEVARATCAAGRRADGTYVKVRGR